MSITPGAGDEIGGLEGIRASVGAGNPELYRHVALYLQVLRNVLPERVEQACFHLATQVHVQRYVRLSRGKRLELHRRLRERVKRCCSLLTVEQLAAQARRMAQEKRLQDSQRQRQLLQRLLQQPGKEGEPLEEASAEDLEAEEPSGPPTPLPPGSVRLDLSLPLDRAAFGWSIPLPPKDVGRTDGDGDVDGVDPDDRGMESAFGEGDLEGDGVGDDSEAGAQDGAAAEESEQADAVELMAALMAGLLEGGVLPEGAFSSDDDGNADASAGAASGRDSRSSGVANSPASAGQRRPITGLRSPGGTSDGDPWPPEAELAMPAAMLDGSESPWDQAALPQDPIQLLTWLDGLEQALARRLRNLSHAINVDLLRLGLSRGLLPVSLLEAVLQGQIETLSSPANLLRLQLPFGLSPGAPPMQAVAVLLRAVDLEMEEPRLRTCRRRIHQHRQQVRKMSQTYRRLQRRLQAHQAERLWLQDIKASRETGS